jgi:hypothetical protein
MACRKGVSTFSGVIEREFGLAEAKQRLLVVGIGNEGCLKEPLRVGGRALTQRNLPEKAVRYRARGKALQLLPEFSRGKVDFVLFPVKLSKARVDAGNS